MDLYELLFMSLTNKSGNDNVYNDLRRHVIRIFIDFYCNNTIGHSDDIQSLTIDTWIRRRNVRCKHTNIMIGPFG
jgi:hypothetical protein